ncbi:DinB family protein [Paenibacillus doosanensis]|uniref:DinB family protein n=1 Tax=Paenibacillus doosanensis TaxID=1229154 RepID=UPI00217F9FFE|nr:DinB family protein [Paenibacillus doosanensis]MCS7458993.1 DinB family protein [Paenibacillus doosanensis]
MFTTIQQFIEEYGQESANTQKLLYALTDESLNREIAPGYRTLGHLAWHLVPSGGLLHPTGLKFEAPDERSEAPSSAAAIAEAYRAASQSLIDAVRNQWTDAKLQETATVFGQPWKNGLTLHVFQKHEIHHRGQLTILMRQAGLPVTGVYGPTKEEWAALGMEAPV